MSGPIIRKYGFPNFERIFGQRPLEHGVDDPDQKENPPEIERSEASSAEQNRVVESRKTDDEPKK